MRARWQNLYIQPLQIFKQNIKWPEKTPTLERKLVVIFFAYNPINAYRESLNKPFTQKKWKITKLQKLKFNFVLRFLIIFSYEKEPP